MHLGCASYGRKAACRAAKRVVRVRRKKLPRRLSDTIDLLRQERGEPIVCTPRDAIAAFWSSPLDALVIGPYLVEKNK